MSIDIKIQIPDASCLQSKGHTRNAIFRIAEAGCVVDNAVFMEIYRKLEGKPKYDFATRIIGATNLERPYLEELFTNHKRSEFIRARAMTTQPSLTDVEANDLFREFAKKRGIKIKNLAKKSKHALVWGGEVKFIGSIFSWLQNSSGGPFVQRYSIDSLAKGVTPRSIDLFEEEVLYELSTNIVAALDIFEADGYGMSYMPWWVGSYIGAISCGTRTLPIVPLMQCNNNSIATKATEAFLYLTDKGAS